MPYNWVNGDVITSTRLNAIEQDRAPVTVQSINGAPNGILTAYPVSTLRMATANIGDYVYLFGGFNSTSVNQTTVYRYSVSGNSYTAMASLASARAYLATAVGSDVYLIASGATAETLRYNVATNTYTTLTAYGTTGCVAIAAIGTSIYFMTSSGTTLVRYDTVANSYSTMAAIPSGLRYRMATDGTNLYLFSGTNSYLYNVAGNTYTAKASINSGAGLFPALTSDVFTHGSLYIGSSGSTRNKNKIWIQYWADGPSAYDESAIIVYDITANGFSGLSVLPNAEMYQSFCAIPANEAIISFNQNTNFATPWNFGSVKLFTTFLSPFTATGQGVAFSYQPANTLRNETTSATGITVPFKTGDVITNNASRGPDYGGSAVAAIDAIVIQKG